MIDEKKKAEVLEHCEIEMKNTKTARPSPVPSESTIPIKEPSSTAREIVQALSLHLPITFKVENRDTKNLRLITACLKHIEKLLTIIANQAMDGLYLFRKSPIKATKEITLIIDDFNGVAYHVKHEDDTFEMFLSSRHLVTFSKRFGVPYLGKEIHVSHPSINTRESFFIP
jgi:hypothetical protein